MPWTAEQHAAYRRDARKALSLVAGQGDAFDGPAPKLTPPDWPDDPGAALAEWSAAKLVVPSGRLRGQPFELAPFQVDWLRGALADDTTEAALSIARKNGKSGLVAVLLLGFLAGPLRLEAWRGIVVSLTGNLARELLLQIRDIAEHSKLSGVTVRATPPPGRVIGVSGEVQILASDRAAGHALGADVAVIDEAGLLPESRRDLWDAVKTSVSGRDGKVLSISVQATGPMFAELVARADAPGIFVDVYAAHPEAALDDPAAWADANPGMVAGIKSPDYMAARAREAMANPAAQPGFRSLDLNQQVHPEHETLLAPDALADVAPIAAGGSEWTVGVDLGARGRLPWIVAVSDTGCVESFPAVHGEPERLAKATPFGGALVEAVNAYEVPVVDDPGEWMVETLERLDGPFRLAADRQRRTEITRLLRRVEGVQDVAWRHVASLAPTPEVSHAIRSLRRAVESGAWAWEPSRLDRIALSSQRVERRHGEPYLPDRTALAWALAAGYIPSHEPSPRRAAVIV